MRTIDEFTTIRFDWSRIGNLQLEASPAGWDFAPIRPDMALPDDGFVEGLALSGGPDAGGALGGLSVSLTYSGAGAPGPQGFEVADPVTLAVPASDNEAGVGRAAAADGVHVRLRLGRTIMRSLPTALLGLSLALAAQAAPIPGLYGTGVDDAGTSLPGAAVDPHYLVVDGLHAPAQPFLVSLLPASYLPNSATSAWIWERADGQPSFVVRTYRLTFDLSDLDPDTAVIRGLWATDDLGRDILLNGVSTGQFVSGFDRLKAFSLSDGFVAGINTIDFVVENGGSVGAFRVDSIAGDATALLPEPGSAALALAGLALVLAGRRRSAR